MKHLSGAEKAQTIAYFPFPDAGRSSPFSHKSCALIRTVKSNTTADEWGKSDDNSRMQAWGMGHGRTRLALKSTLRWRVSPSEPNTRLDD